MCEIDLFCLVNTCLVFYSHFISSPLFFFFFYHVSSQVDAEDSDGAQRQRDVDQDEEQEGCDLRDVAGQCVGDGLFQIVKDESACRDRHQINTVVTSEALLSTSTPRVESFSPSSTPVTMEAKLSSRRIMSAACLDTSEPEIPMATPMSAFFSAGESFTPSPVTATMAP